MVFHNGKTKLNFNAKTYYDNITAIVDYKSTNHK
jgi:hypothetical protein